MHLLDEGLDEGDQPLSQIFSIARNVHHLLSAHPSSVAKMDKAVEILSKEIPQESGAQCTIRLRLEVLIATMPWAFRSKPDGLGTRDP
jgi:hypothetical protein